MTDYLNLPKDLQTQGEAPLVDIHLTDDLELIGEQFDHAAQEWGAAWLVDHGVENAQFQRLYDISEQFYDLPVEEKRRYSAHAGGDVRGYTGLFEESNDPTAMGDRKECYDIRLDLPADDPDYLAGNEFYGPNPWPKNMPEFKDEALAYQDACLAMTMRIMAGMARHLQLNDQALINHFQKPLINLRLLHYPVEPSDQSVDPKRIGTGAHTDYECLTLLHQRGEGGLQAQNKDGIWYAVRPRPNAILLSVGDSLVRWSGGRYRALPHRVVNTSGRRRFSLPFFLGGDASAIITPWEELGLKDALNRYPPISQMDYLKDRYGGTFVAKDWSADTN